MKRFIAILAVALLAAASAHAASIVIGSDQASYEVGDTVTVTFTAIVAAETSTQVYGDILFSNPAMVVDPSVVQFPILSFGVIPWVLGTNPCSSTVCTIMNQIGGLSPMPVSNSPLVIAILTFTAGAVGTLDMNWDATTFDFFGAVNQPGASITVVPEPTTSALLALGLTGIAAVRRRSNSPCATESLSSPD